jgi:hypothetical protein
VNRQIKVTIPRGSAKLNYAVTVDGIKMPERQNKSEKPIVYIASPYTSGDPAINTHFQCRMFDKILHDGKAWPVAPLWSHFQHTLFPRPYADWIEYDKALLRLCDACLRLAADVPDLNYRQYDSAGADQEAEYSSRLGKPVFFSLEELYEWIDMGRPVDADQGKAHAPVRP